MLRCAVFLRLVIELPPLHVDFHSIVCPLTGGSARSECSFLHVTAVYSALLIPHNLIHQAKLKSETVYEVSRSDCLTQDFVVLIALLALSHFEKIGFWKALSVKRVHQLVRPYVYMILCYAVS